MHEVPDENCHCGYYASSEVGKLRRVFMNQASPFIGRRQLTLCVGEVALWGKVVRHELGMRATYAYPLRLYLMSDRHGGAEMVATELASDYGISISLVPRALAETWGTSEWTSLVEDGGVREIPAS